MAKQNNLQLYRGQGIPPANSMLEGEIAMDTDRKVLWINNGQAIKPVGIIEGGTTPPADYAGTLWIDNNASPTGIPANFLVANNLTTQAPGAYVLDAYQGKILKDALDAQQLVISDQSDEISELSDQINNLSIDYIVEQGTNGIWTYRKWASGISECWGYLATTGSSGSSTFGSATIAYYFCTANFPSELFIQAPTPSVCAVDAGGGTCAAALDSISATSITIVTIGTNTSISGSHVHCIGKWK